MHQLLRVKADTSLVKGVFKQIYLYVGVMHLSVHTVLNLSSRHLAVQPVIKLEAYSSCHY